MALDDILFLTTGSYSSPGVILYIPVSGSTGSLTLIEPQTIKFEVKLVRPEIISIF